MATLLPCIRGPVVELPLKSGDILFVSTPNYLYRKVAQATGSPASHVGIAFEDPQRGWLVAESAVPWARKTVTPASQLRSEALRTVMQA